MLEAMEILENKNNRVVFHAIQERLEQGEEVNAFFCSYLSLKYRTYVKEFLPFLSFLEAILLAIEIVKQEEKNRSKMQKGLLYPCGLFLTMCFGMYGFNHTVLPNMLSLLDMFQVSDLQTVWIAKMIEKGSFLLMLVVIFAGLAAVLFLRPKRICQTYRRISSLFPNGLFVQYASLQFSRFFLECSKKNIPTRESLILMMQIKERPLIGMLADSLQMLFTQGETMSHAVAVVPIEKSLVTCMKLAVYASDTPRMLQSYLEMSSQRSEKQIAFFTKGIQMLTYGMVGIVVVFVYRILMLPLSMLQQIG